MKAGAVGSVTVVDLGSSTAPGTKETLRRPLVGCVVGTGVACHPADRGHCTSEHHHIPTESAWETCSQDCH